MSAALAAEGGGRWRIDGELDFASTAALYRRTDELLRSDATLDLGGVEHANSAGVALLLEWRRQAARRSVSLAFEDVPESVLRVARLSNVADLVLGGETAAETRPS